MSKSSPPKHGRRTDTNHRQVIDDMRRRSYIVDDWSQSGNGIPDALVRVAGGVWMEIKTETEYIKEGHGLTDAEKKFFETAPGHKIITYSAEDAHEKIQKILSEKT